MKYLALNLAVLFCISAQAQLDIIGGEIATGTKAPWQLSLKSKFGSHFCGAVLIKPNVALTAAHCVWSDGPGDFSVNGNSMAGSLSATKRISGVKDIIVHPDFEREHFTAHDIAIIILSSSITASESLRPIAILDKSFEMEIDKEFHSLTGIDWLWETSGWGMTKPPNLLQEPSEQMMSTSQTPLASSNVSLIDPEIQKYLFEKYEIGEKTIARIQSKNAKSLLAEGIDKIAGTCSGDSGGPFLVKHKDQYRLAGISSYTAGGEKQCLGVSVYTNVQAYSDWIMAEVEGL